MKINEIPPGYTFSDAQTALSQINLWAKESKTPIEILPVIDALTETEVKGPYREEVMRVYEMAAVALQSRFNRGQVTITERQYGERQVQAPGSTKIEGSRSLLMGPEGQVILTDANQARSSQNPKILHLESHHE